MMMETKAYWETIYKTKGPNEVSWYQARPDQSIAFIDASSSSPEVRILDVGGGASTLVDHLLEKGYRDISVLDITATALTRAKSRLGSKAKFVHWIEGDVRNMALPFHHYDVWHDRAVFHFLTEKTDREAYIRTLRATLKSDGSVILATFALDGPPRCSNLDVIRYSPESLSAELGPEFKLIQTVAETHQTPFSTEQKFIYCLFRLSASWQSSQRG